MTLDSRFRGNDGGGTHQRVSAVTEIATGLYRSIFKNPVHPFILAILIQTKFLPFFTLHPVPPALGKVTGDGLINCQCTVPLEIQKVVPQDCEDFG